PSTTQTKPSSSTRKTRNRAFRSRPAVDVTSWPGRKTATLGPPLVQLGQNLHAIRGERDGMLEMGRPTPVGGDHRPPVLQHPDLMGPRVHHGLDGQGQSRPHPHAPPRGPKVGNLGVLMHVPSNAMADELPHHGKSGRLHMLLDG